MSVPARLAAFSGVLAVVLGGGALAGAAIGPEAADREAGAETSHSAQREEATHGGEKDVADPVRGLAVAENGLRVLVDDPELGRDRKEALAFRIVDAHGETVRDFDVEHTKRMHLIIARRDLTGFQHLHPEQRANGTWRTDVRLREAGSYRLFADFSYGGEAQTLATDLRVDGSADLRALPASKPIAASDGGYDVRLDAHQVRPGQEADLRFSVSKDGKPVATDQYLGAGGHLVALREGDLAFLHVHPTGSGHGDDDARARDDSVGFAATFPTEGRYRLFLQFQHEGRVQTVAFTQEVK